MQKTLVKPHPKFPLTPHQNGYWVKKILGKTYYIGPRWATPEVALDEWKRTKDDLYAGETPKPAADSLNVKDGMNFFLCDRLNELERGEIVQRTYEDYVNSCKHIVGTFGASTPVASLTSTHFATLRDSFTGVSPHTITNRVTRAKVAFKWLFDEEYISKASSQLAAMILLGVNVGFGNADCGNLPIEKLDLVEGWHIFGRPKTGIERRAWLWPETVEALRAVIGDRLSALAADFRSAIAA